ncbi:MULTISPECIES: DUF1656 domain-containing protein [unclassified Acinetobacter]|uniref:DUF1656 domain-containing protein n=1 Tax=unclassified Acinetobacter TaxID=196816 RepID=UPI0025789066|nr:MULTISPECIES: DUF1656 domain-containing protein [unclassified Acinetobacter]MDM1765131.1 DUF1656 domain-containing protein [Acinetobacter sp. 226-1]MDM1768521.1 DUF1656 domain-containing protein [Acinetobacter sp. 226-4]
MGEFNLYGVYVPTFLVQAILAYLLLKIVNLVTDRWATQDWIALPSIFNLCIYVLLLWGVHHLFTMYLD